MKRPKYKELLIENENLKRLLSDKDLIKAKEQVEISELKYRTIFEGAPLGIFRATKTGRLIEVNKACATLYGYDSPDEMIRMITDVGHQLYSEPIKRLSVYKQILTNKISRPKFK